MKERLKLYGINYNEYYYALVLAENKESAIAKLNSTNWHIDTGKVDIESIYEVDMSDSKVLIDTMEVD